jgi:tetratricopeptide (TPR) repeat protein
MLDPRAIERSMADLTRYIEEQGLETPDEVEQLVKRITEDGEFPDYEPQSDVERAQNTMYDVWGETSPRKRVRLAKQALKISPDCADAYVLLAEEAAKTAEQAYDLYRAGVAAGGRALGEDAFARDKGHFWEIMATRPYLRALFGLAQLEIELGETDEGIATLRRIIELNPIDNQGARYQLLSILLETDETAEVHKLLRQYKDDFASAWAYGRALVTFLEHGNTRHSRANLQEALQRNIYFPAYLLGAIPLPDELPAYMEIGGETEGLNLYYEQGAAWAAHEKALDWLVEVIGRTPPPR